MNIIFLDIDGVMNSNIFYKKRHSKRWFKLHTYTCKIIKWIKFIFNGFKHDYSLNYEKYNKNPKYKTFKYKYNRLIEETDKLKWKWLIEFCNITNTKICISSVWKNSFNEDSTINLEWWQKAFINLGFKNNIFIGITKNLKGIRGIEIKEFIDKREEVFKYIILDDDSDMLEEQKVKNFIHIDNYYGLTPNHIYKIKNYFKI